jgi:hypothetical protein
MWVVRADGSRAEVAMMGRIVLGFGLALVCLSPPAVAQIRPAVERASAGSDTATLSAEERIRRATVPPPGTACPPDPADAVRAALGRKHARNLAFVTVSDVTIQRALEVSKSEWAKRHTELSRDSQRDWESWVRGKESEGMTWTALPPCPEPGLPGQANTAGNTERFGRGLASLVAQVLGPRRARPDPRPACQPGDAACEAEAAKQAGLSAPSAELGDEAMRCQPRETPGLELYSSVRGKLMASRMGARLLLASASNVPVSCSVDVSIERLGKVVQRKNIEIRGAGSSGVIVREVALGFEPDVYQDTLVLNAACVPRVVWGRSRPSGAEVRR